MGRSMQALHSQERCASKRTIPVEGLAPDDDRRPWSKGLLDLLLGSPAAIRRCHLFALYFHSAWVIETHGRHPALINPMMPPMPQCCTYCLSLQAEDVEARSASVIFIPHHADLELQGVSTEARSVQGRNCALCGETGTVSI